MNRKTHLAAALLLAIVLWVQLGYRLGEKGLWSRGEGRVALIAQTMLDRGDWVVPRAGSRLVLTKPPMTHWIVAASLAVGGANETAARLPVVILAALLICLTGWIAARFYGPAAGWMSALVLASTPQFARQARTLQIDMVLAFWVGVVFAAWIAWWGSRSSRSSALWRGVGWAATAGATLTKGPVGLLIPVLVVALAGFGRTPPETAPRQRRSWFAPSSWLLWAVLTLPWFILLTARLGGLEFLKGFFSGDVGRALGFRQPEGHSQPFWYYVPRVVVDFAPWSLFLPLAIGVRERLRDDAGRAEEAPDRLVPAWAWVVLIGYSLMGKKTARYLLPVYPALSILVGAAWADARARVPGGRRRAGFFAAIAAVGLFLGILSIVLFDLAGRNVLLSTPWIRDRLGQKDLWTIDALRPVLADARIGVFVLSIGLGSLVVVALACWARRRVTATFVCLVAGVTLVAGIHRAVLVPIVDRTRSTRPLAEAIRPALEPGEELVVIGPHEYSFSYSLPFYAGRPLRWYPNAETFLREYRAEGATAVVAPEADAQRLPASERFRIRGEPVDLVPFRDRAYRLLHLVPDDG